MGVFGRTLSVERLGLARRLLTLLRTDRDGELIDAEEVDEAMECE